MMRVDLECELLHYGLPDASMSNKKLHKSNQLRWAGGGGGGLLAKIRHRDMFSSMFCRKYHKR